MLISDVELALPQGIYLFLGYSTKDEELLQAVTGEGVTETIGAIQGLVSYHNINSNKVSCHLVLIDASYNEGFSCRAIVASCYTHTWMRTSCCKPSWTSSRFTARPATSPRNCSTGKRYEIGTRNNIHKMCLIIALIYLRRNASSRLNRSAVRSTRTTRTCGVTWCSRWSKCRRRWPTCRRRRRSPQPQLPQSPTQRQPQIFYFNSLCSRVSFILFIRYSKN